MEAFRRGECDRLEIIGEADEREFFELCLREKILQALAESMPTERKKIEMLPRFEPFSLAPVQCHCGASCFHSAELHPAAMATLEVAPRGIGRGHSRIDAMP